MKLSISNIGWPVELDNQVYALMKKYKFSGLEIAPTRIFSDRPYDKLNEATIWAESLKRDHSLIVSSMQSIWYGRQENIFGTDKEFDILLGYTKKAIEFATRIGCKNIVFGCPKQRCMPEGVDPNIGINFFKAIGEYAVTRGTVIGIEANPAIYNTNYINDTLSAFKIIEQVGSEGIKLNLDLGTMIQNNEMVDELKGKIHLINHIHISEPYLAPIKRRELHIEVQRLLREEGYKGFVSIEMGKIDCVTILEEKMKYVREIFYI